MKNDDLGNRMKENYEERSRTYLTRRTPVIIRLDICHAHTFTRGFKKPFDKIFVQTMQDTMKYLCEHIQGCVLGYTQSDEITLVLTDYANFNTSAWFDYQVQKIVSVSASMASLAFSQNFCKNLVNFEFDLLDEELEGTSYEENEEYLKILRKARDEGAYFDARAFNIPKEDLANCILWRQKDCERNSILSLGQAHFSHKELQGKNCKEVEMMLEDKGVVWGELPTHLKRGSCCIKQLYYVDSNGNKIANMEDTCTDTEGVGIYNKTGDVLLGVSNVSKTVNCTAPALTLRSNWIIDTEIPRFINEGREYIEKLI